MRFLRQNTAVIISVGPFYDATDGVTIETALTITNERITLTADTDDGAAPTNVLDNVTGATSGTSNDLNYITGNDAGMMQLELSAADTNRVGRMLLSVTDAANHAPVFHEFFVLPQAVYDWLTGAVAYLPDGSIRAATLASDTITAAKIATDAIGSDEIASSAATEIGAASGMSITRSTGALVGASETAGVGIASGATYDGAEVDLLGDNTSRGMATLYLCFTASDRVGNLTVNIKNARVSGQAYQDKGLSFVVPGDQTGKVLLGRTPVSRYMSASVINKLTTGNAANVAVLYELEKEG